MRETSSIRLPLSLNLPREGEDRGKGHRLPLAGGKKRQFQQAREGAGQPCDHLTTIVF